jgi:ABC-type multidrug transport system fused ATPase/permease subunit
MLGAQSSRLERLAAQESGLLAAKAAHSRRAGLEHAATDVLSTVGIVGVVVVGAVLVSRDALSPSLLPVAVILAAASVVPVASVLDVARDLNLAGAAAKRVFAILRARPAVEDRAHPEARGALRPSPSPSPSLPLAPGLVLENVTFRYRENLPWAVDGATFEVRPGETVALVGPSGAGKSTVVSLALRLWDVAGGAVKVGGRDVRSLSQETLRDMVTLVPQDTYLFNTSLRENIRLGTPEASDVAVETAARAAMAHELISALPGGYDASVGELGGRLSGGQRQRIAIARALLRDAPILIMDEAVSNLDATSEAELAGAMAAARRGRTSLIVAHRLSTIRSAERLLVMDRGRIVEQGSHDELLARGGFYARLISPQLTNTGEAQ